MTGDALVETAGDDRGRDRLVAVGLSVLELLEVVEGVLVRVLRMSKAAAWNGLGLTHSCVYCVTLSVNACVYCATLSVRPARMRFARNLTP